MRGLCNSLGLAIAILGAAPLTAQEISPFDLNEERIKLSGEGRLGDSKTFFIPTYYVMVSVSGSVWSRKGGAQAHGRFFVDGLEKPLMQGLARKAYDDLVTKMRGAGYTVVTYDDLKNEQAITDRDHLEINKKFGLPTKKDRSGSPTYVVGTPSDEMALGYGITGPHWSHRGAAKEKNMVVMVPELWLETPLMGGTTSEGYKRSEAGIEIVPAMQLQLFNMWGINPKQAGILVQVQEHGMRLASENTGTIDKLKETKTDFSDEWKRVSGDYSFTINPQALTVGVLRVAYAINDLLVEQVKKAQK